MHTRAQAFRSHGADIALDYAADRNGREVAQPVRQVADIMSISFIADCRLEAPRSGSVIPPRSGDSNGHGACTVLVAAIDRGAGHRRIDVGIPTLGEPVGR